MQLLTNRPSAIFALNNQIALGALRALKELNIKIPQEVSLLSFDEQPYFEFLNPPLSAIEQPIQDIGKIAVDTLLNFTKGKAVSAIELAPNLIKRKSVLFCAK